MEFDPKARDGVVARSVAGDALPEIFCSKIAEMHFVYLSVESEIIKLIFTVYCRGYSTHPLIKWKKIVNYR